MQDTPSRHVADARLASFAGTRGMQLAFLGAALTLVFVGVMLLTAATTAGTPGNLALSIDFRVFWAAGQLVLSGEPLAALDTARLEAVHATNTDSWMPWLYPPGYLMLMAPFGAMGFAAAFILSTVLSLILIALAVRPFTAGIMPLWLAMVFAPAYLPALMIGQNSLFWMAGLLAALAALRDQRWILAGVCIGCLTLKPQLGLMIPFALLAIGAWRTILAASLTAIVLAALPTLAFGAEYWPQLVENLGRQGSRMMASIADLNLMVGPLSLLASFGVPAELALGLQWALTATAAVAVFALWRSPRIGFDAKAAGLLTAILISSPYLWYYEAALMAGIALFAMRANILPARLPHLVLSGLLWLGTGPLAISVFLDLDRQWLVGAVLITPVLLASLALCLKRLFRPDPVIGPATAGPRII